MTFRLDLATLPQRTPTGVPTTTSSQWHTMSPEQHKAVEEYMAKAVFPPANKYACHWEFHPNQTNGKLVACYCAGIFTTNPEE